MIRSVRSLSEAQLAMSTALSGHLGEASPVAKDFEYAQSVVDAVQRPLFDGMEDLTLRRTADMQDVVAAFTERLEGQKKLQQEHKKAVKKGGEREEAAAAKLASYSRSLATDLEDFLIYWCVAFFACLCVCVFVFL